MGVVPSSNLRILENKDLMRLLRSEVKQAGGQSAWARRQHIDRTMLNRILNGRKPVTKEIIRALKLCNVYAFDDDSTERGATGFRRIVILRRQALWPAHRRLVLRACPRCATAFPRPQGTAAASASLMTMRHSAWSERPAAPSGVMPSKPNLRRISEEVRFARSRSDCFPVENVRRRRCLVDRGQPEKKAGHYRWSVYTPGDREFPINPKIAALAARIQILEAELEAELAQRRAELSVGLERGRAFFEEEILRRHRELRTRLSTYLLNARPLVVVTAPVIYAVIVPLVLLDLFVSIYQRVCFPVYGIPKVNRGDYLIFDRHHLAYLNALEKLNCAYCSYANGLIAYVREIAGRTEQYWCPIKHARRVIGAHPGYSAFADYGDAEEYRRWLEQFHRDRAGNR